jgi:hypothetical protein
MAGSQFCIEVQTGAGQGRESSLKARPGGTASSRTADDAQVAQLVEQGTENPRVGGSNPSLGTILPARSLPLIQDADPVFLRFVKADVMDPSPDRVTGFQ